MGTVLDITVVADDAATARRLAAEAVETAKRWDDVLTTWRPGGELYQLNARAGRPAAAISAELSRALARMVELSAATAGAFDPAVGPLVAARRDRRVTAPPVVESRHHIATALRLGDGEAALVEGAALDAGGVGKGMALDAIADRLKAAGATAAFLNFGGSSQLAFGRSEDGSDWAVALAGKEHDRVLGAFVLRDASLSTSRAIVADDPAGTIIDPRTGAAVKPPLLATVVAGDATTAEAWSTALIVLGTAGLAAATAAGVDALVDAVAGVERTSGFGLEAATDAAPARSDAPGERPTQR